MANWIVQLELGNQSFLDEEPPTSSLNMSQFYFWPFPISLFCVFEQDETTQEYPFRVGEYRYILHFLQQLHNGP